MSDKLLTGHSPIAVVINEEHTQSISIDISDFRMTPVITSMSVKNKQTTPISRIGHVLDNSSGANSKLELQGISGAVVSSSA